jgi:hypothetical protein
MRVLLAIALTFAGMAYSFSEAAAGQPKFWLGLTLPYVVLLALAYGASMLPTLWLLRDPDAGLNPLLITAAVGCGLIWSFLAAQFGRLAPVIISHMAFTYFTIVQFRLPGM